MGFPLKVTITYALFSILWITTSDRAVSILFPPEEVFTVQSYKSWFFVAFTSVMLLLFLIQETRRRERNEKMLAEQRDSINKLSTAVSQSPNSIVVCDIDGTVEYVNEAFESMSGYTCEEVLGKKSNIFGSDRNPQSVYDELWAAIKEGQIWQGELLKKGKNGSSYWVHTRVSPVQEEDGTIAHFLAIEEDISERKAQENRIRHQANYDSLTELPNRFLAMDRMSQAINNAIRHEQTVVMMFIDLDDFSRINESMGQDIGDQLITLAAARVSETIRQTDTVARYGGDEFMVILNHLDNANDAPRVAEKVLASLANPFFIDDKELNISASIGMSIFPEDGQDPYELLRHADAAMFAAKDEGGNRYEFYSADVNQAAVERMGVEQRLRSAMDNQEFTLAYQPLVDLASGTIASVEVLLRWNNKELGAVAPNKFIPLAEATGLIVPIGEWVIHNACAQLKQWHDQGMRHLNLMINLSPRQFKDINLVSTLTTALEQNQLTGDQLELEVTENILSRNRDEAELIVERLKSIGVRLALDDFGTGSSSLNHLKNFPFDTIKIDRSYIDRLVTESDDQALVEGTVIMAKGLGLKTVGEGVETDEQFSYLKAKGFDGVQGFLFTPALAAADFERYYQQFQEQSSSGDAS
ncbi:MAG: EAL domain-containing protein [Motiliproteus sp.]|nr:EAL domain-containing protein [Motiliproteus sp.]MCW9053992.1 EAL domain-containing protein [Motiliproteus sp.]